MLGRRRPLLAIIAGVLVVITGTGCSNSAHGSSSGAGTRTIKDIEGTTVTVPDHPTRVITLSEPTLDGAIALGVTPIGTTSGRGQSTVPHYLNAQAGRIPILGAIAQPNYEAIGKAKPDLILVDSTSINDPRAISMLRHIAPVVYCGNASGNWRVAFGYVADALNLADKGKTVLAEYDGRVAQVKTQLGDTFANDTFSIVRWQGTSPALIAPDLPPGVALTDLGLKRPPHQSRVGSGHADPVSLENLADIDADYMFFGSLGGSSVSNPNAGGTVDVAGVSKALAVAEAVPGFTNLTAYKDKHITLVDGSLWNSVGGPLLMNGIVDSVQKSLIG